ncbi:hypothetical protein [Brevibacillus borstelensis]|uniref:hypothetical protein n=1 Tax=Brevibacillus borstelensis TaxID=45462 RepID=UPI0030C41DAC
MLMKWLEPTIEKRVDEIFDELIQKDQLDLYQKLIELVKNREEVDGELIFEIENSLLLMIKCAVDTSYRAGLYEMSELKK